MLIAKFAYNNIKNASINHILFELNCSYHLQIFFKDNVDPCLKSHFANKLVKKLKKLIDICKQNLFHLQKLQKKHIIKT